MTAKTAIKGVIAVVVAVTVGLVALSVQSRGVDLGTGSQGAGPASNAGAPSQASPIAGGGSIPPATQFFGTPNPALRIQIENLRADAEDSDAALIEAMVEIPTATWFTDGSPSDVADRVASSISDASEADAVPVLVVYNVPGRDCSLYSAGGAESDTAYEAWIDAIAEAIHSAGSASCWVPAVTGGGEAWVRKRQCLEVPAPA